MKCSHPQCLCAAGSVTKDNAAYCSTACANMGATPGDEPMSRCSCGHAGCSPGAQ